MPPGIPEGAICVQRFDDSRNSAIHITYRISLRSSSMPEPRDPLLKVLFYLCFPTQTAKNLADLVTTLVDNRPGNSVPQLPHGRAHQSKRRKVQQGWPGERSAPFQGDPHGLLMILPQVHLRNGFEEMQHTQSPSGFPEGPTIS
jgi:hypothetical protein